jgi:ABC-type transporter Mla subunit MlaD
MTSFMKKLVNLVKGFFKPFEEAGVFIEKEITMALPQAFSDAVDRIKALLATGASDAQTVTQLQGQVTDLTNQVKSLISAGAAKDTQIAALQQQVTDMTNALLAVSPDPTPGGMPATPTTTA